MFELIMIAFYMMKLPSIILQPFDNFSAIHNVCTIHTNDESVKIDLVILPKIAFDPYGKRKRNRSIIHSVCIPTQNMGTRRPLAILSRFVFLLNSSSPRESKLKPFIVYYRKCIPVNEGCLK